MMIMYVNASLSLYVCNFQLFGHNELVTPLILEFVKRIQEHKYQEDSITQQESLLQKLL